MLTQILPVSQKSAKEKPNIQGIFRFKILVKLEENKMVTYAIYSQLIDFLSYNNIFSYRFLLEKK